MCSRYSLTSPPEAVRAYFDLPDCEPFPPRYNIAPTQPALIVRRSGRGGREAVLVRWGLIPGWVRDFSKLPTMINARAESLLEKPSFRGAIRHKRCLVPTDGFYEWTGKAGAKQPHLIRPRGNAPMAFAAIFEDWMGADGSEIDSMAIITVPANETMRGIHDRMPAILQPEHFAAWLDVRGIDAPEAVSLIGPAPDDLLTTAKVSRKLNNPRNEGPDLLVPDEPGLL